ncbi:hypothetical protein AB0H49_19225 [Nocardia sp. NPDC050713]|uniref:hypothetical protein n=1 Tax=Nocardia sp. NPDC050713 TaxID=3154511 RepID=UPI0033D53787
MTALLTFLVVSAFCYTIYHYSPKRTKNLFALERFRPLESITNSGVAHYEELRQYSDLAAIHSRADEPRPNDSPALAAVDGRAGRPKPEVSPTAAPQVSGVRRASDLCRSGFQASSRKLA